MIRLIWISDQEVCVDDVADVDWILIIAAVVKIW
jgi:hypothetical protein